MVVDAASRFLSQRELSHMALIEARNVATGITLTAPGMESISIPFPGPDAEPLDVVVWRDTVRAAAAGAAADVWMALRSASPAGWSIWRTQLAGKSIRPSPQPGRRSISPTDSQFC